MSNFYRGLRRTNRVYNSPSGFIADHASLIRNDIPSGFNLLQNPTNVPTSNNMYLPGYGDPTNFTSNSTVNRVMRNNDVPAMKQMFPGATDSQINTLGNLRQIDNVPDATLNSLSTRQDAVRNNNPETATRSREGVQQALDKNPRLTQYLKTAGVVGITGATIYLVVNVADMVGSIVDAMNRTGGSWWYRGNNGANSFDTIEGCILRGRSCGMNFQQIAEFVCVDPHNPGWRDPILTDQELLTVCEGHNTIAEQTVCRASDPYAPIDSRAYYDVSLLNTNEIIQCVEPYDLADLIGDLGLDGLLGDNGLLTNSSKGLNSLSDNFFTILIVVGGVVLLLFIMYVVIKSLNKPKT
ncbi:PIF-5 [Betabaculovirus altermyunipunctae]|uniref:PIF-5 n=1 Tax=Betabaculovirus altermyunipunctae TaxID=3051996 RepID=A0A1S5YDW4_9BBAC|nr:PIF-5 [Betabaculovirus altermyunipunctae]AQQ80282.1 PIF-5 [Betabaculovirus altermyunipunctae]